MSAPKTYTKSYNNFLGADFTTDATQVDERHSPVCENIVADYAGYPEKRVGWRKLYQVDAPVNAIWHAVFASGAEYMLIHGGQKLYKLQDTGAPTAFYTGMNDAKSTAFAHGGRFYILDGAKYLVVYEDGDNGDALTADEVKNNAYVPTTFAGASPDGVTTGMAYEEVNLLSDSRKNSFIGDALSTIYRLDARGVTAIEKVEVNGEEVAADGYTFLAANESFLNYPTVTFNTAPDISTDGAGLDNVIITFALPVEGNLDKIQKCTIAEEYGYYNADRFFFAGNPAEKNMDYASGIDDPTYWPEYGWTKVGSDTSAILGYLKHGGALAILKEDNEQDAEVYLRTAQLGADGAVLFPVKQGIKGTGAVSKYCFDYLPDDALFLSKDGVCAVVSTNVPDERRVVNRSYYVNKKLRAENGLDQAVGCTWDGLYMVCVGGHCYVTDSKKSAGGNEWYYWTNVPARVFRTVGDALYFGCADGWVCRFNNDIDHLSKYQDGGELEDGVISGGTAILARWSTKSDDFGSITQRKTLVKRGSGVMIKPFTRSSVKVYLMTESHSKQLIRQENMDILDFTQIDFERVSFLAMEAPQTIAFNKKMKKFVVLQVFCENDVINEGFGVYGVELQYVYANYVK